MYCFESTIDSIYAFMMKKYTGKELEETYDDRGCYIISKFYIYKVWTTTLFINGEL